MQRKTSCSCEIICYRYTQNCSKIAIEKSAEATDKLIGNKIADKITGSSRIVPSKTLDE